jgi:cytochrome c peroxidase
MPGIRGLFQRVAGGRKWFIVAGALSVATVASAAVIIPNLFPFLDPTGLVATYNTAGAINENPNSNAFFQSLGTNGRTCGSCHFASDGMGLSVRSVQAKFLETRGRDPLFAAIDGANCPNSASQDPSSHSLLLKNGLIRIFLPVPSGAQFQIKAYRDPYGCGSVIDPTTGVQTISIYRRPLPTTNLRYLSAIMFDGRETHQALTSEATFGPALQFDLMQQAVDAVTTHAQATVPPTTDQQNAIVSFELGLSSAQTYDFLAGVLNFANALGGPANLSQQSYYPGTNDSLGADPHGNAFNSSAFTLYASWANSPDPMRRKIAAGEALFNTRALTITSVRGLNDNTALAAALGTTVPIASFQGTCTTCHDAPNIGNHSFPLALDIGTGHDPAKENDPLIANGLSALSLADAPVYEITGCPNPFQDPTQPVVPYVIYTTDPGKGLVTGLCSDVSRTKGPVLRGLASRAPYFHNGAAQNLSELLEFYNQRFQMNLTAKEKDELTAFLNAL